MDGHCVTHPDAAAEESEPGKHENVPARARLVSVSAWLLRAKGQQAHVKYSRMAAPNSLRVDRGVLQGDGVSCAAVRGRCAAARSHQ